MWVGKFNTDNNMFCEYYCYFHKYPADVCSNIIDKCMSSGIGARVRTLPKLLH